MNIKQPDKKKEKNFNYLDVAYDLKEKPITEYPEKLIKHILSLLLFNEKNNESIKVLDVGCGRGDQLKIFEKFNFDSHGLDIDSHSDQLLNNVNLCNFRKDKMPFKDESFDITFCKSVIEHLYLEEIENLMLEKKRILKKKGYLIILTPSWEFNVKNFYTEYSHVTPFTKRSLEQCIKSYSFKNVKVEYLIQLPFVWKYPYLKFLCDIINFLKLPRSFGKLTRWSQERMLLAIAQK